MNHANLKTITKGWADATHRVLCLEKLPLPPLQNLLKETYRVLATFCKEECIPKEIAQIILEMEEFLYFAALMEEKEMGNGYYHWQEIRFIVNGLKKGFFDGGYEYAFPKLKITDVLDNDYLMDFETNRLEGYIAAVQQAKAEEI